MSKFKDLTGQRFGRLTVIERAEDRVTPSGSKKIRWLCRCDCGNTKIVCGSELNSGDTRSCGCLHKEQLSQRLKKDLTGQKFGRLTVLFQTDTQYTKSGRPVIAYHCVCDCGREIDVRGQHLLSGNTKSCGCLQREAITITGHNQKEYNMYDLSGSYGIGYTHKGEKFYFDLEDYSKIRKYCWQKQQDGYIVAKDVNTGKNVELHRIIMGTQNVKFDTGIRVDHIKTEEKFDNRKCNLRIVQHYENCRNHKLLSTNTSGVSGVNYVKSQHKWVARINLKGKRYYLGKFDCFEDAVIARKSAEEKLYGEYSYNNSQKIAALNERMD